jgi:hypothetical protein
MTMALTLTIVIGTLTRELAALLSHRKIPDGSRNPVSPPVTIAEYLRLLVH